MYWCPEAHQSWRLAAVVLLVLVHSLAAWVLALLCASVEPPLKNGVSAGPAFFNVKGAVSFCVCFSQSDSSRLNMMVEI